MITKPACKYLWNNGVFLGESNFSQASILQDNFRHGLEDTPFAGVHPEFSTGTNSINVGLKSGFVSGNTPYKY